MALVGPAWAAEILFSARRLEADEALRIGLVNRVVPVDELEATVRELAATIAGNAPLTVQACKAAIREAQREPSAARPRRGRAHGRGVLPLRGLPRGPGRVRREAGAAVPGPVMPTRAERALEKVRTICAALPEVEERPSHGAPTFFYRGKKTFVMFHDDHHGDGRLAIWCARAGRRAAPAGHRGTGAVLRAGLRRAPRMGRCAPRRRRRLGRGRRHRARRVPHGRATEGCRGARRRWRLTESGRRRRPGAGDHGETPEEEERAAGDGHDVAGRGAAVGGVEHVERQQQEPGPNGGERTGSIRHRGKLARRNGLLA